MKKFLVSLVLIFSLIMPSIAAAAMSVPQGGTGVGTLTGIVRGNGTAPFSAVTVGSGLLFSGGTLSATNAGTVTSVSGTTNRITSTGGATPVLDISGSYVGQSSITTLGTIGTGVWQGSSISTSFTDAKLKTLTGTANRITIGGTSTDPTADISTSYVGQSTITTLGTITTGVWTGTAIANANLANSTISGISLGSNLNALTATDTSLTFSGSYNGSTARTIGLNLGNANTWTGKQTFNTTAPTFGTITGSTQCLHVDTNGLLSGTGSDCGSGSGGLTVGTTSIASGTDGRVLYDNAGTLGEMTTTGSGTVLALATSPALTTPKVITSLNDTNGNEIFKVTATGSAVNEFTITNAAAGANPQLSGTGGDTDIGLNFLTKGAGKFRFLATASGPTELRLLEDSDNGTNYVGLIAPASMASDFTLTLPGATDTLVGKATTDTFTNKTFDTAGSGNAFAINGTSITAVSGTGSVCLTTSCAMTTPNLGTPSALTLTNATGLPIAGITGLGSGVGTWLATPSSANLITAMTDETGSGALVFGTSPTIATPVLNGTPTGTGVATAATASTLVLRDSNANITANNWLGGYTTTATAAGTTTLTVGSTYLQFFTGSTTQTLKLPVVSTLVLGTQYIVVNNSSGAVTVQSSGANAIVVLAGSTSASFTSIATSGTDQTVWSYGYIADIVASGKKLTVNNTLTLAGTDSTTMTFPTTSATIARTDAANTFTGHQTIEGVTSTGATGTGKFVFDNTPTLVTPALGAATYTTLVGGNITDSGLTSGRITMAGTSGILQDDSDLTFATDTLTATKLVGSTSLVINSGTALTTTNQTGTGSLVLATSPTLVTPALGTPSSGTLTNTTGLPEGGLSLTDITTNDSSTSKHGFLKKLDNTAAHYMDGTGAWSTPPSGGFSVQDIPLTVTGNNISDAYKVTSNATGTLLFMAEKHSASSSNFTIYRLVKDATSGNYYVTHSTTLSTADTTIGLAVVGSNLYVSCRIAAADALRKYSTTDLSGVTTVTFSGTSRSGDMWSDGTNLFLPAASNTYDKFTISGTVATNNSNISYTSSGGAGSVSDGTSVWIEDNGFQGAVTVRKYPIAGGAASSSTAMVIQGNAVFTGGLGGGLFIASGTMTGLSWAWQSVSATATIGTSAHLMAIGS